MIKSVRSTFSAPKKSHRRAQFARRLMAGEQLETRVLLAGDGLSAWQNPVDPLDVDGNNIVTSLDMFKIMRDLIQNGPHELADQASGEPDLGLAATSNYYPDVDGNANVTALDALLVARRLNGEGEGEAVMQFRLEVTNANGTPITTASVGEQIQLRGYIQDLRDASIATGLFAAYVDVQYDASLVSVASGSAITFSSEFSNGTSGDTSVAGLIDEVGAFIDGSTGADNQEQLLFTISMETAGAGNLTFSTNEADDFPTHETLFFSPTTRIDADDVMFGSVDLTVVTTGTATAEDDELIVLEDSTNVPLEVLANDGFTAGSDATITGLTTSTLQGTATIATDGKTVLYTPPSDFFGMDSFMYDVSSTEGTASATVFITVENVDDPPNANDDVYPEDWDSDDPQRVTLREDATDVFILPVLANDTFLPDPETVDELISITQVTDGTGTVTDNTFNVTYTPSPDFFGPDTFTYTIKAFGSDLTDTATVTVIVAEVNDAPIAVGESFTLKPDDAHVYTAGELLANDLPGPANENNQSLAIVSVDYDGAGTVTLAENGNISYVPAVGFLGEETITYTIRDDGTTEGVADPQTATATFSVDVTANIVARDDSFTVPFESADNELDVLENDFSPLERSFHILETADPAHGVVQIIEGSRLSYTPDSGFAGTDIFTYTIEDDNNETETALVRITVDSDAPTAVDDQFTVGGRETLDVLGNDVLGTGATTLMVQEAGTPSHGTATIVSGGTEIQYQPDARFVGADSFTYTLRDNTGKTSTASVSLTVTEDNANSDPVALNDEFEVDAGEASQELDVLLNDTSLPDEGETLSIAEITMHPDHGIATINASLDRILYTPDTNFAGVDVLTYLIDDGHGGTDTATVRITVVEVPPVAQNDTFDVDSLDAQIFDVLSNDLGEAGESLSITALQAESAQGDVQINTDGTRIIYTPPFNFAGTDTFTYTVDDGTGLEANATVTVNVQDVVAASFFSGFVFMDGNNNARRDPGERGLAGVAVVLEGADTNGSDVRQETKTAVDGSFQFDGIAPGTYTITEEQPVFLADGQELLADQSMNGDQFTITVTNQLIKSDGNLFGEQGLVPNLSGFDSLASSHQPGLFMVLDGDELSWLEDRGGWSDLISIDVTLNDNTLSIRVRDANGIETTGTVSLSDTSKVQRLGRSDNFLVLRIMGTSQDVLGATISAAAVDEVFA